MCPPRTHLVIGNTLLDKWGSGVWWAYWYNPSESLSLELRRGRSAACCGCCYELCVCGMLRPAFPSLPRYTCPVHSKVSYTSRALVSQDTSPLPLLIWIWTFTSEKILLVDAFCCKQSFTKVFLTHFWLHSYFFTLHSLRPIFNLQSYWHCYRTWIFFKNGLLSSCNGLWSILLIIQ